jgi:hypothetical protein
MRYSGRVARIVECRTHKTFLIRRKLTRARSVRRYKLTWKDNIKMHLQKIGWED